MCLSFGEVLVRPLAEALAAEQRGRTRERLTAILLAFGAVARRTIERLKNSANAAVRRTAIQLMRQFGGSDALPELAELLDDNEPQVQREAVRAILNIGTDKAFQVLQEALATGNEQSRNAIMQSISSVRDERAKLLRSIHVMKPGDVDTLAVRGQYAGYRVEPDVNPHSRTETYAAATFYVDNWRWAGVPFFIRTGKLLPVTQTELRLVFKHAPRLGFAVLERRPEPNQLVIKLDPTTGVRIVLDARRADARVAAPIPFDVELADVGGEGATPYEVLLEAAMRGDTARFPRQDQIEETWRIMQPLLDAPPPVQVYEAGSWGPESANTLVADHGGWHEPWIAT